MSQPQGPSASFARVTWRCRQLWQHWQVQWVIYCREEVNRGGRDDALQISSFQSPQKYCYCRKFPLHPCSSVPLQTVSTVLEDWRLLTELQQVCHVGKIAYLNRKMGNQCEMVWRKGITWWRHNSKFDGQSDGNNTKHVIAAVFHHFAGTLSALRKKVKHQPQIINTINHAICSVVPGMMLWIW